MKIYLAYFKNNTLLGRIEESDIAKYKKQGLQVMVTDEDNVDEVEKSFKPIPTTSSRNVTNIGNTPPTIHQGFNYSLIPNKSIEEIRKAYNESDHDKMKEFRIKYEVADKCPTCTGAAKRYEYRVWQNYFENILKE